MKKFVSLLLSVMVSCVAMAQVTTSSMSGRVTDENDQPLPGTVVVAVHTPSGTEYASVVDSKGYYRIQNMRSGGPYKVTFQMLGYKTVENEGIMLALGDNYVLNQVMPEETTGIEQVVVTGTRNNIINSDRTGASTNVTSRDLATLPTISRSINDFTRLTPQAGTNSSFGGRDGRYNNIMIDGASFNNRFGLSTNNMPGGSAQPISLDAVQEVTVNVSPFDIRESNFTGASVNAVTRSGDNHLQGSVYTYFRPKSFTGDKVRGETVKDAKTRTAQTYGLRLGGPIVKNKLFYFVSGEYEKNSSPGIAWTPSQDGKSDSKTMTSRTTYADLDRVKNHLVSKYGYDPGVYEGFDNFIDKNYKIMARVDWNISKKHSLTLRYNYVHNTSDQAVNNNSCPSGLTRGSNRYSVDAFTFSNSNYGFINKVNSLTGELNSKFKDNVFNKLLFTYSSIQDTRTSDSDLFPFVDIWQDGKQYMSFGYELFTYNNDVRNRSFTITDNVTVGLGKHTLVAGASFERQYVKNAYMRNPLSYYRYNSVDDFINDNTPSGFGITYPYGSNATPGVELTFGMVSAYVQDEWIIDPKFKLTAGLRFEVPLYFNDISAGSDTEVTGFGKVTDMAFDEGYRVDMGTWPKTQLLVSPRLGFNWDLTGDRKYQIRGGTGLFTGMLPFVWFTNQPNGAGFIQSPEIALGTSSSPVPADMKFNPDWNAQRKTYENLFPTTPGQVGKGSNLAKVADDFKMPQVWRSNIAADISIPWGMILTLEAIYTKDVNAVVQRNLNLPTLQATGETNRFGGADNRPFWTNNKVVSSVGQMMLLDNTSKGHQTALTVQLTKKFDNGFSGMVAYTYTAAKDMSANPGSTAGSAWSSNTAVDNLNYPGLSYSNFAMPHRVTGYVSYTKEYARHLATTVSLYYTGSHSGRTSYTYSNDLNGDGNASDLIYIPKNADEIHFVDIYEKDKNDNVVGTEVIYSAEDQSRDFFEYIENTPYLRDRKGKYAERFGDLKNWVNRFDIKIIQDVFTKFGTNNRYTLQLSLDILNVGNLLNSKWGTYDYYGLASYDNISPLTVYTEGKKAQYIMNGNIKTPQFTLNTTKGAADFKNKAYATGSLSTTSTWGMMLGVRLLF